MNPSVVLTPRFVIGRLVATTPALMAIRDKYPQPLDVEEFIASLINRHTTGDWGNLTLIDRELNDEAVRIGGRIHSSYDTPCGTMWVITEWDRSYTTVLLPDDY